ncbi:hypothetical protein ACJJTC_000913 [Scirpophaga incertulas]
MTIDLSFEDKGYLQIVLLVQRVVCIILLSVLLMIHIKSVRVFRWEHTVSGGLLVTYTIAMLGLALLTVFQNKNKGAKAFQVYICATGAISMATNAAVLYNRWRRAGDLTRVLAELLSALGLPLHRQLMYKIVFSAIIAVVLLIDIGVCTLS